MISNSILTESDSYNAPSTASHNFKSLFYQFMHSVSDDIELYAKKKRNLIFPKLSKSTIIDLCHESEIIFRTEPSLIDLQSPCFIVGDLHGHVLDLFRILKHCGIPHDDHLNPKFKDDSNFEYTIQGGKVCDTKYVFLGDIIDRGEFSVETITIVFLLKILFPSKVYLIRGNHEFDFLAKQCGFLEQVFNAFNDSESSTSSNRNHGEIWSSGEPDIDSGPEVYSAFMSAFSYLPFGVRIDNKMLCVHGGIGPQVFSVKSVSEIKRPITEFSINDVADSLLWSDPSDKPDLGGRPQNSATTKVNLPTSLPPGSTFSDPIISPLVSTFSEDRIESAHVHTETKLFEPSNRGTGFIFGEPALHEFLHYSNLDVLVRAHECVMAGCEEMFNGRLITVFSASNYCGFVRNFSAVLHVKGECSLDEKVTPISERCEVLRFFPLDYLRKPVSLNLGIRGSQFSARSGNSSARSDSLSARPGNFSARPDNFSARPGNFSARSDNLSARADSSSDRQASGSLISRRGPSITGKSAPISRSPLSPLNDAERHDRITGSKTEADGSNLHIVSPRDTHKMAGIRLFSSSLYNSRDIDIGQSSGRGKPASAMKRGNSQMSELPSIVVPRSGKQGAQLKTPQLTPQGGMRFNTAGIALMPKVKPRARSEFK